MASPTASVNINMKFTTGITNFVITYVSDTDMHLSWNYDPSAYENVMIRSSYVTYPADITDPAVAPSNGNLVYYGNGTTFDDTSMDFNQNAGSIYYKMWAQKIDGTWEIVTSSGTKESREVILIALIALGVICSYFGIVKRQWLFTIGGAAAWFLLIPYTRTNPIASVGSTTDTMFLFICGAMAIGTIITTMVMNNNHNAEQQEKYRNSRDYRSEQDMNRHNARGSVYESVDDYQERLARLSHRKRR